ASGLEVLYDTTDASGVATLEAKGGNYWVVATFEKPYSELYWNHPVIISGEMDPVRLDSENATERPKF
ncbi:uncharacterized protein METZ01_LOCUS102347, partial [marine metagenome]